MNLSKSKYCEGFQCKKLLWLEEHKSEVKEEKNNESIYETGTEVGKYAKNLFGSFINIEYNEHLNQMIEDTKKVLEKETICNITEASFLYNNNFCSVDILRKNNDKYEIYEVKSSSKVKDIYLEDASYQYYVLNNLGYKIEKTCIVYVNNKYIRKDKLDIHELFTIKDISDEVLSRQKDIEERINTFQKYLEQKEEPKESIDMHCMEPYNCPYFSYCTATLPKPNIFSISGMQNKEKFKLYRNNIITYQDLIKEKLKEKYLEQIDFELNNKSPKIEKINLKKFLTTLKEPLYFLDFETFQQAIPLYEGVSPYEQIPFQYSLHYLENGKLYHKEFLGEAGIDPRRSLAEQLIKDIPKDVCTLAYNMSFEKSVIKRLSIMYPDLSEHLMNIYDNIKDLMVPFYKREYYTKEMQGSYSIKYVLPALFPNDPSLNYHNLDEIHNGSEAMNAFSTLSELTKEEQEKRRNNLLKYCELDTYAMVKIYTKIKQTVGK